jgi:hypothetical protein
MLNRTANVCITVVSGFGNVVLRAISGAWCRRFVS